MARCLVGTGGRAWADAEAVHAAGANRRYFPEHLKQAIFNRGNLPPLI